MGGVTIVPAVLKWGLHKAIRAGNLRLCVHFKINMILIFKYRTV
jgi:hypothetical protein